MSVKASLGSITLIISAIFLYRGGCTIIDLRPKESRIENIEDYLDSVCHYDGYMTANEDMVVKWSKDVRYLLELLNNFIKEAEQNDAKAKREI